MQQDMDVIIIGAGTAGLSAYKEAVQFTDKVRLIDKGPLGTTCARIGCMPSKQLISIANQYFQRLYMDKIGIKNSSKLTVDIPDILKYVRRKRDHFTSGVIEYTESLGKHFICGEAKFVDAHTVIVNQKRIYAKRIIIATGSSNFIPPEWSVNNTSLLTSENLFEQTNLSKNICVIGGGPIGLEMGQALSRLEINIQLFHGSQFIGGLTDPEVNNKAIEILSNEFPMLLGEKVTVREEGKTLFIIETPSKSYHAEGVLSAVGTVPNLNNLCLEEIDINYYKHKIPLFDNYTMQLQNQPIFIAGDVNKFRPLLHEAVDEGRIAGYNATHPTEINCFHRRTPIHIVFTKPNIAVIGRTFKDLKGENIVIGEIDYSNQGRATIEDQNAGLLRVYGLRSSGKLLGAECIAPDGEHLAHLLAWSIEQDLSAFDLLKMPYYHPVIEEGLRTALRQLAKQVSESRPSFELTVCNSPPVSG
jgi:dihydrolipoamide dehydrogenase